MTFMANDRTDHVTMFTLHLSLTVSSFSVKLISFALASIVKINFQHSHM